MVNGTEYKVPRESLYVPLDEYDELMAVEITYIDGWDEWLFGLTFLENYYTVYDMDQQRIGFAMSKSSSMNPQTANEPTTSLLANAEATSIASKGDASSLGSYAACAAIPLLAMGLLYKACKTNKSASSSVASGT